MSLRCRARANGLGTIDPHLQDTLANFSILGNVYEPLVQTDAALQPKPDLAERWESPDPLTWVFSLRKACASTTGSCSTPATSSTACAACSPTLRSTRASTSGTEQGHGAR